MAERWRWASCTIDHWKTTETKVVQGLSAEFSADPDPQAAYRTALLASTGSTTLPSDQTAFAQNMAYSVDFGQAKMFARVLGQETHLHFTSKAADLVATVETYLPRLRDGIQTAHLPKWLRFYALLPRWMRHVFLWPRLTGSVDITEEAPGGHALVSGKLISVPNVLNITTLGAALGGALLSLPLDPSGVDSVLESLIPLYAGLVPAGLQLLGNLYRRWTAKLEWSVNR